MRAKYIRFGFIHILRSQKHTHQLNLLLGAIRPGIQEQRPRYHHGCKHAPEAAKNAGFEYIDSHLELETNVKVRAEMEKMQGQVYKRFRIFKKELVNVPGRSQPEKWLSNLKSQDCLQDRPGLSLYYGGL